MIDMTGKYECRKCGQYVQEGQKRCMSCGALQPYSGFKIDTEGDSVPLNGFAVFGLGTSMCAWFVHYYGIVAVVAFVLSLIGLITAPLKGQKGVLLAVCGIIISIAAFAWPFLWVAFLEMLEERFYEWGREHLMF